MNWWKVIDRIFPVVEPLTAEQQAAKRESLQRDLDAIEAATWSNCDERALDEAQRIVTVEAERVKTAEAKATTSLAVLAALVPLILTIQAANWEKRSGPAPEGLKLLVLAAATIHVAGAGYHAFKAQQVSGFERVSEGQLAAAWRSRRPLSRLTRATLVASRRSRDAVNEKITRVLATHAHLWRAFGFFVLLLLLDPIFYALGSRELSQQTTQSSSVGAIKEVPIARQSTSPPMRSAPPSGSDPRSASPNGTQPTDATSPKLPVHER